MKKRIIRIIAAIILTALAVGMTACGDKNIYDQLAEDGYTVKVIYDAGGAVVNETQNVTIVEVFNADDVVTTSDGKTGIRLLAPDDAARGNDGKFKLAKTDGVSNFFQVGWYTKRTLRVDEKGNALDSYGVPTAQSGREQGYVYENKWDFNKDVVDPESLENGEMVLYAAWVPYFTYEFYSQNSEGAFEKIGSVQKKELKIPTWNEALEKYKMNDFPKNDDMSFVGAYFDAEMTQEISENIDGSKLFVDNESGTVKSTIVKIYIAWEAEA